MVFLEGRFEEAEDEFLKAGKPREAIDMWCHQQNWDAARHIAEHDDPGALPDILTSQASSSAYSSLRAAWTMEATKDLLDFLLVSMHFFQDVQYIWTIKEWVFS